MDKINLEILQCKDCDRLAIAINDVRFGHKCSGSWTTVQSIQTTRNRIIDAMPEDENARPASNRRSGSINSFRRRSARRPG